MHGFINSPALAKLVALQMVDEQVAANRRKKPRARRTRLSDRLLARRTRPVAPATPRRTTPAPTARQLAGDGR